MRRDVDVSLRAVEGWDLYLLHKWRNDPRIWKWCRQNTYISLEHQQAWFKRQREDASIKMYAVQAKSSTDKGLTPVLVGVVGLTSVDRLNQTAEFSLYIDPDKHGQGLGEMALRSLLNHGFRDHNLNVIWGESFYGNPAMRLFEKMGFGLDGIRPAAYYRDGKFIDAHLYSMTRKTWETECSSHALHSSA